MKAMQLSREIMKHLNAFDGSKPVVHNNDAMLIKGISRNKVPIDEREDTLKETFKKLGVTELDTESERVRELTDKIDQVFRNTTEVFDESNGILGIERLKQTFEMTGFAINYIMGEKENLAVSIAMWSDQSGHGPIFVECMVINIDATEYQNNNTKLDDGMIFDMNNDNLPFDNNSNNLPF